jgi:hypothetical protein
LRHFFLDPFLISRANVVERGAGMAAFLWGILVVCTTLLLAVTGALLVRRWVAVEVLERHNEVAGFIYAVIGVVYAVLLGFTAIIVWERYDKAQAALETETNDLTDLFRDAETFPNDVRTQLGNQLRKYTRLVAEKEWPAMAERRSSPEASDAYTQLWRTYYQFQPENDRDKIWYTESITKLNDLGDQRRLRLLSSRFKAVPSIIWAVLIGAGGITIGFTLLFGTRNFAAQVVMISGLALTIALVMLSIMALQQPFAGINRLGPQGFKQLEETFKRLEATRSG